MSKRRIIIALLALAGLVLVELLISMRSNQPSSEGRTLSAWLEIYRFAGTEKITWEQRDKAAEAVPANGTNALPLLLEWIRDEPSSSQRLLGKAIDPPHDFSLSRRRLRR